MVDVGSKAPTRRRARASGRITMLAETAALIHSGQAAKGDVLAVARLAGIQAAKRTALLIPLCHSLPVDHIDVDFRFVGETLLEASAVVSVSAKTGVEMEALTAVAVALLTVYDMLKAVDREMEIGPIRLEEKSGGKSGFFARGENPAR